MSPCLSLRLTGAFYKFHGDRFSNEGGLGVDRCPVCNYHLFSWIDRATGNLTRAAWNVGDELDAIRGSRMEFDSFGAVFDRERNSIVAIDPYKRAL